MLRTTFRHFSADGAILESDLIEATVEEWAASDEARDPAWSVASPCRLGLIRALRRSSLPGSRNASPCCLRIAGE